MKAATKTGYEDDRASINLVNDHKTLTHIKTLIAEKQQLKPSYLIVVGIGGSNLGTIAVQEAVLGKQYNQTNPPLKILYADTVDTDLIHSIITIIKPELENNAQILINGISKSGGTTETLANFQILLNLLKQYKTNIKENVIITTDKNSRLWHYAEKQQYAHLEIPKKVGGRYSVFSAVGLFPLGMLGIDIDQLLKGAYAMRQHCLSTTKETNPAATSAAHIYSHYTQGKNIHDLFLFSTDLESIGKWYRQLMGESIGKEHDRNNNQIFTGITPTVSIGSTDLHSMAQLYLGGPYDKFTTFVRIQKNTSNISLPTDNALASLLPMIQNKTLPDLMDAILTGVQQAFINGKRPFIEIQLPDKKPSTIGQLLQFKEMEMMYLGALFNVNPFDQPNVEAYKIETKNILEGA